MRRVSQNLPPILISRSLRKLAGVNIFNEHRAACPANARHFSQHLQWFLQMMQRQPAHHYVERSIFEGKMLRIRSAKENIANAPRRSALFGDRQHGVRQVDAHNFARSPGERFRDVSGPRRDVEHPFVPGKVSGRN